MQLSFWNDASSLLQKNDAKNSLCMPRMKEERCIEIENGKLIKAYIIDMIQLFISMFISKPKTLDPLRLQWTR
jgi:hypothetical protein